MVQPEGKRRLERQRNSQENNFKMGLQEVECEGLDWIDLAHERDRRRAHVHATMKRLVPYHTGNVLTSWEPINFSRRILLHVVRRKICPCRRQCGIYHGVDFESTYSKSHQVRVEDQTALALQI